MHNNCTNISSDKPYIQDADLITFYADEVTVASFDNTSIDRVYGGINNELFILNIYILLLYLIKNSLYNIKKLLVLGFIRQTFILIIVILQIHILKMVLYI